MTSKDVDAGLFIRLFLITFVAVPALIAMLLNA
jgi:hypothetical protein